MCGIVGLFLKDRSMEAELGSLLSAMLVTMTDRGPDSAGIAIYTDAEAGTEKITVQADDPDVAFASIGDVKGVRDVRRKSTHAVLSVMSGEVDAVRERLTGTFGDRVRIMSVGKTIEIYKEVGLPKDVAARFDLASMSGTHGIGHTRMATESAVTTMGAHPFSTGPDQCLVHNGSLSNHNSLRRRLRRDGVRIETLNDTEVGAAYLTWRMSDHDRGGYDLGQALEASLDDLDGFFTFVVGTRDGFGVVRDPIACKPAVMAETDRYVAFGSEYRALVDLPGIEGARVWEPEPATVYFWSHDGAGQPMKAAA